MIQEVIATAAGDEIQPEYVLLPRCCAGGGGSASTSTGGLVGLLIIKCKLTTYNPIPKALNPRYCFGMPKNRRLGGASKKVLNP